MKRRRPHELKPLAGLRIVGCRPRDQMRDLTNHLTAAGAEVVSAPVIAIADPDDGGDALLSALARLSTGDWLVLTSPNGAQRVAAFGSLPRGVSVAAIGPGTAQRAAAVGLTARLVPDRAVAEGLLEAFPAPPQREDSGGLVVLARAAVARSTLPDGLRDAGWEVIDAPAYRNVAARLDSDQMREVASSDGVVFTSSSTVDRLVAEVGEGMIPPLVASIGPATSATVTSHGLQVTVEASEHTVEGVVKALIEHAQSW